MDFILLLLLLLLMILVLVKLNRNNPAVNTQVLKKKV